MLEHGAYSVELMTAIAVEARGVRGVPMELHDAIVRDAARLMEPVHVLCDDGAHGAPAHEFGNGEVSAVRASRVEHARRREAPTPGFDARSFLRDEFPEVDRAIVRPDPTRAAKIRNAGLGAEARSREDDRASRFPHQPS